MVKMQLADGVPDDLAGVPQGEIQVILIPKGMTSGQAAIVLRVRASGREVEVKTTAKLWLDIAEAIKDKTKTKH